MLIKHLQKSYVTKLKPLGQKMDNFTHKYIHSVPYSYEIEKLNNRIPLLIENPQYPNYITFNLFIRGGKTLENKETPKMMEFLK